MLLRPTLVLILLQLHASNTLTDGDKEQNVSTRKMKRIRRTVGAVQHKRPSHEPSKSIPLQDEDLLDLMVRIAQSPSEWERIQQVLSQLGDKKKLEEPRRKEGVLTYSDSMPSESSRSKTPVHSSSNLHVSTVTSLPSIYKIKYDDSTAHQSSQPTTSDDYDSGWPDFEEAILKKVRKPESVRDTVLQNNLYENDWFDTSWSDLLSEEQDRESPSQSLNVQSSAVRFVKLNISESANDKKSIPLRKSTYSALDVFDLPSRENMPTHNEDYVEDLTNRSSRPVFVYHRVTTSPQERNANSAIIAVSVARREQDALSSAASNKESTQRIQVNFEDSFKRNFERHRSKERKQFSPKSVSPEHLRHHTHSRH